MDVRTDPARKSGDPVLINIPPDEKAEGILRARQGIVITIDMCCQATSSAPGDYLRFAWQ